MTSHCLFLSTFSFLISRVKSVLCFKDSYCISCSHNCLTSALLSLNCHGVKGDLEKSLPEAAVIEVVFGLRELFQIHELIREEQRT